MGSASLFWPSRLEGGCHLSCRLLSPNLPSPRLESNLSVGAETWKSGAPKGGMPKISGFFPCPASFFILFSVVFAVPGPEMYDWSSRTPVAPKLAIVDLTKAQLAKVDHGLFVTPFDTLINAEIEIGRSRNWPKSSILPPEGGGPADCSGFWFHPKPSHPNDTFIHFSNVHPNLT